MIHRTQGNAYSYLLIYLIKNMIKDTDEQLNKEIHREGSGCRNFCPLKVRSVSPCQCGSVHPSGSSPSLIFPGFFKIEASSHRHDWSLSPFSTLLPDLNRNEGLGLEILSLVFLVTSPHQEATQEITQSHFIRTKDTPTIQEIARVSGTLCHRWGSKTKY